MSKDELPAFGFIRLNQILAPRGPIPVSKSTWWAGIRSGRFPKAIKIGPRMAAWDVAVIRQLVTEIASKETDTYKVASPPHSTHLSHASERNSDRQG